MNIYVQLADRVGMKESKRIPRLFQLLADESEAAILLSMPGTLPELSEKLKIPETDLEPKLKGLFRKGVVFVSRKTSPPTYKMSRDSIQLHDASALWPEAPQELLDLWQEWFETEWIDMAKEIEKHQVKEGSRLIPILASLDANSNVLNFENIESIVRGARNLAVTKCTCRTHAKKCDRLIESCIQFDGGADYAIERGTGRKITADEAMDIFRMAAEAGLVPLTVNMRKVTTLVCNCCPCCCQSLPLLIHHGLHMTAPTRYQAVINPDLCNGCGICHGRCHFGAMSWQAEEGGISAVIAENCMGCGLCQIKCPTKAITMIEIRSEGYVPEKFSHPTAQTYAGGGSGSSQA